MIAHTRDDGKTQSVKEHLDHVSCMAGKYGSTIGLKACAQIAGLLHDTAKLSKEFQSYILNDANNLNKHQKGPDHSTAGGVYIMKYAEKLIKEKESVTKALTAEIIAIVCLYHHGGLGDLLNMEGESPFLKRLNKYQEDLEWNMQYKEAIHHFFELYSKSLIDELFDEAVKEIQVVYRKIREKKLTLHFSFGLVTKYIYSCLIDADRYDSATFCNHETMIPPQDYQKIWEILADRMNEKVIGLPNDTRLNKLRGNISNSCYKNASLPKGIYKLNCPTGSGKNYAAFRFALNMAKKQNKARIFYVAPFISIIEQNTEAIRKILRKDEEDNLIDEVMLELHSAKEVQKDDMYVQHNNENIEDTTLKMEELWTENMEAPIVCITLVRFLNTFFAGGTKNIRALHNFSNSIIILDETQTIPIKTIAMINDTINFLAEICSCTIILSTATQPALDHTPDEVPSLLHVGKEISECTEEMRFAFRRTEFVDLSYGKKNTVEEISQNVWNAMEKEGDALVIFNTIASVHCLYEEVMLMYQQQIKEEDIAIYVLTTNLCAAHRKDSMNKIRSELGKKKVIVISTQLIEAGVDLSFQVVFRAIAGLDSLIQSAGRCNRHGEFSCKNVYIINPDFENLNRLQDLVRGKDTMENLLRVYEENQKRFAHDLSSDEAVSYYYKKYYEKQKEQMLYPVKTETNRYVNLYTILGKNEQLRCDCRKNALQNEKKLVIAQSFKTAAQNFHIIDEYGQPVLVPYKEGKQVICNLLAEETNYMVGKTNLLRKAQLYMVNISMNKFYELCNKQAITYYENPGLYILHEGYYHSLYGVATDVVNEVENYMF